MRENRRSITIHDVAKVAGVSVSTVSRVLNNKADVATPTADHVKAVIDDLGYTSSLAARGMRSRNTHVIGLIIPEVSSPYSVEVMRGVNQVIAHSEYDLLVFTKGDTRKYHTSDQGRRFVLLLNGSIADGVILVAPPDLKICTSSPLVVIDPNSENTSCPGIIATNHAAAVEVVRYLASLGHRKIGHIAGRLELVSARQRLEGYKDGLASMGIPLDEELIQWGDFTEEGSLDCARALLSLASPPTAIFASNDMTALGVYRAASERGLKIPQDVSVVGFDNLPMVANLNPPLTSVSQPVEVMGKMAAQMVIQMVKGVMPDESLFILDTQLVIRESCTRLQ